MDKQEFARFTMALKTYYPKEKLIPNEPAMELWFNQLKDISYDVAELFLNKWVVTNNWSPTIADIRGGVTDLTQGEIEDWGKGWAQVERAIRVYGMYRIEEAYESMDEITREVAKRIGFQNICTSSNAQNDRANFRMLYEQIAQRKKLDRQLNPDIKKLMDEKRMMIESNENRID